MLYKCLVIAGRTFKVGPRTERVKTFHQIPLGCGLVSTVAAAVDNSRDVHKGSSTLPSVDGGTITSQTLAYRPTNPGVAPGFYCGRATGRINMCQLERWESIREKLKSTAICNQFIAMTCVGSDSRPE